MQVAVEVRVEPKPRADWALGVGVRWSLAVPDHPARAASFDIRIDQCVVRETAPGFQVLAKASFAASDSHEIPGITSAQCSDKLGKQAGGKCSLAGIDFDFRFGTHTLLLAIRQTFDRPWHLPSNR
jgi:hypothetical protein